MSRAPLVTVLCGSASEESEVSRVSGRAIATALAENFEAELVDLPANFLPDNILPEETVIFPALHGTFGEDGQLQAMLEERGFAYAGSDAASSALCMNKINAKAIVADTGFAFADDITFYSPTPPSAEEMVASMGDSLVVKPIDKGSSVGLHIIDGIDHLERVLHELPPGAWMIEQRLQGREMTVGILDGKAMGIVEIVPEGGVYDYAHKYTSGASDYRYPAEIDERLAQHIRESAESVFTVCGCRDFARVDFILVEEGRPCFLEINTIPGLTATSLLPKSASCKGLDFPQLARRMLLPAIERYNQKFSIPHG
ncbi:D-alanine--D-alanine ligase [Rubellicoccus peritrichatus]|uniref:D-alanine--D-alanine ligase n=1 Tax=Rubellicoccus peritrichatus TaxID=3080537 RepID=A0AAQ3LGP2_9BACT|nr:D-alanine--D-alanine ligase [Puniceicoccus sp. CR14]WOO43555.1 D-alanine--D-alanine ligase [Puniceicoccus sp. CR14]